MAFFSPFYRTENTGIHNDKFIIHCIGTNEVNEDICCLGRTSTESKLFNRDLCMCRTILATRVFRQWFSPPSTWIQGILSGSFARSGNTRSTEPGAKHRLLAWKITQQRPPQLNSSTLSVHLAVRFYWRWFYSSRNLFHALKTHPAESCRAHKRIEWQLGRERGGKNFMRALRWAHNRSMKSMKTIEP